MTFMYFGIYGECSPSGPGTRRKFFTWIIILVVSNSLHQLIIGSPQLTGTELISVEIKRTNAIGEGSQSSAQHRALYLHAEENKTGEQIKKMMTGYRLDCRLLHVKDLNAAALQDVELIIVDAGTKESWDIAAALEVIKKSKLPVFAMGEGGAELFGKLELWIGTPNGQLRKVTPLKPNSEAIFWDAFQPELVDGAYDFSSKGEQVSLKVKGASEDLVILATESENQEFSPLIVQKPFYLLWGFNGTYDQMTGTGRQLFAWACYYSMAMKKHPDRAFKSKSEVERVREKNK